MNSISWNRIAHFRCDWKYNSGALERSICPNWPFEICPTLPFRNILGLIWYFELDSAYQEVQFYLISDAKIEFCIIIINSLSRMTFSHKNIKFFDVKIPRITWFQPIWIQIVAEFILIQNFWSTLIFPDCHGIFDPIQKVEPKLHQPKISNKRNLLISQLKAKRRNKSLWYCVIRGMIGLTYNKWFCFMFNRKLFWSWIQNFVLFHVQKLGFCC